MCIASLVTAHIQWNTLGDWKFICTKNNYISKHRTNACKQKKVWLHKKNKKKV